MRIKILFFVFCFLLSILSYAHIKIGVLYYNPPYIMSFGGYDIALSRQICKRLNEHCEFIRLNTNQIYKALLDNKVDIFLGGMLPLNNIDKRFIYSIPYMLSRGQFLVLKSSNLKNVKDLYGSNVGVIIDDIDGGLLYEYLLANYTDQFTIKRYINTDDIINDISNNKISAAFLFHPVVDFWVKNGNRQFKALGHKVQIGDGVAILSTTKHQYLINRINAIILQMDNDNTFTDLYKLYIY